MMPDPIDRSNPIPQVRIAIFASGAGSNARNIIDYFKSNATLKDIDVCISLIVCNKPGAGVIQVAANANVPVLMIERERFFQGDAYIPVLKEKKIDLIVLAGFLWKIPTALINAFPQHIINIHPALLPGFGGKGMYGEHVHKAVIAAGAKESGITIHYVDEHYDNGDTLFQAYCPVNADDTPATLAQRIHELEHEHFPKVIAGIAAKMVKERKAS